MPTCPTCEQSHSKRDGHSPQRSAALRLPTVPTRLHDAFRKRVQRLSFPARGDPDGAALLLQLCALGAAGDGVARRPRGGRLASHDPAVGANLWSVAWAGGPASVSPFRTTVVCG